MALRLVPNVHGVVVMLPSCARGRRSAVVSTAGITGILDPAAPDRRRRRRRTCSPPTTSAPFSSQPAADVMAWKRASSCSTSATPPRRPAPIRTARRRKSSPIEFAEGEACFTSRRAGRGPTAPPAARRKGIPLAVAPGRREEPAGRLDVPEPAAPYRQHGGRLPGTARSCCSGAGTASPRRPTSSCRQRSGVWRRMGSRRAVPCAGTSRRPTVTLEAARPPRLRRRSRWPREVLDVRNRALPRCARCRHGR